MKSVNICDSYLCAIDMSSVHPATRALDLPQESLLTVYRKRRGQSCYEEKEIHVAAFQQNAGPADPLKRVFILMEPPSLHNMVILGDSTCRSKWARVRLGVPQGSVFGPILYILYTADIPLVIDNHDATGHLYADDIQAFVHGSSINQLALVSSIDTRDLHSWMLSIRLCLNSAKTQLIWFGTRQQLLKLDFPQLTNRFPSFTYCFSVRDLGVVLDSSLTFSDHILNLTRSCYFHLRRLREAEEDQSPYRL